MTSDKPVFGRDEVVLAENGDSTSGAGSMEGLLNRDAMKLVLFICCDAKNIMLIDQGGSKRWGIVSSYINDTIWSRRQ